jgi:NADH-quinone oxidoreductase subunit A
VSHGELETLLAQIDRLTEAAAEMLAAEKELGGRAAAKNGRFRQSSRARERQNSLSCALCCAALSLKNNSNQRICGPVRNRRKRYRRMTGILQNYLPLVVFIGVASLIGLALLIAPFLLAFQQPDPEKLSAYECGFNAFDDARMKFDVRFYLVAILFIIFDLEVAFLFPWAVAFGKLGATGFWSMMVFLAVLTIGFAYEWKKGALEWD